MAIVTRSSIPDDAKAEENRGKRARASVGEVSGSGAGAGGDGGPEEYDSDPQAGGGSFPPTSPAPVGEGADAPNHGSR
ncbi:MAG: hypothetical protein IBJ12_00855 [Sphingomonadaceae bacterium]|nr:hypothetical protein [Sphingomonadaceae bacterium]